VRVTAVFLPAVNASELIHRRPNLGWTGKVQAFAILSARPGFWAIVADLRRGGIAPSEK
jgi:hypothetical protein